MQSRVEVIDLRPGTSFDGNQIQTWVEYTFREQQGGKTFQATSVLNWAEDFEKDGETLRLPIRSQTCPRLVTDGQLYDIETVRKAGSDIAILLTCRPASAS